MRGPVKRPAAISLRQALHDVQFAAHVPHAGDAVGNEERQRNVPRIGKPVAKNQMHVHVPQPGNQEKAAAVYDRRVSRILCGLPWAGIGNAIALKDYGLIRLQSARANVNDRHILEHQEIGRRRILRLARRAKTQADQKNNAEARLNEFTCFHRANTNCFPHRVHL